MTNNDVSKKVSIFNKMGILFLLRDLQKNWVLDSIISRPREHHDVSVFYQTPDNCYYVPNLKVYSSLWQKITIYHYCYRITNSVMLGIMLTRCEKQRWLLEKCNLFAKSGHIADLSRQRNLFDSNVLFMSHLGVLQFTKQSKELWLKSISLHNKII